MSAKKLNDTAMWQAVIANNEQYDGAFVYAVRTTGIFCRPSCKSRAPKRTNVEFYADPAAAEDAGYRACKRCQPDALRSPDSQLVVEICRYIEAHIQEGAISLQQLADAFSLSPFHLQRVFKREMGITPREYTDTVRFQVFKDCLRAEQSVTEAIYAAGYTSNSQLYGRVDDQLGMNPSEYQAGGSTLITYAAVRSPLGIVLVAATARGICAVRIGDTVDELVADLRAEFPAAQVGEEGEGLRAVLDLVLQHLAGTAPRLDLPLDIQATAFQKRVWQALRAIPYGETRTYAEIARAIDQPTAARAVGNACGKNPVAIVIPCHRVIKNDGSSGNYRWGEERKERLLVIERQPQPQP